VEQRLDGRQRLEGRQRLLLTQRMRLALSMLQAPFQELRSIIDRELTENPLLEAAPPDVEADAPPDTEWPDYLAGRSDPGYPAGDIPARPVEDVPAPAPSLFDLLVQQLDMAALAAPERRAAEFLAGCLDEAGYLGCPLEEAARALDISRSDALSALRRVQDLDPPGVGARNLAECLTLQLRNVDAGAALIRSLNPRPGERVGPQGPAGCPAPDALIERVGDEFAVALNEGDLPRLVLSPSYRRLLARREGLSAAERDYIRAKMRGATWFLRCLDQRRRTLRRILDCVVAHQRAFLEVGVRGLAPLTLRQVARELGMHESTVGRAVARKYITAPYGTFPLRLLFAGAAVPAPAAAGQSAAAGQTAAAVSAMIRDLVAGEAAGRSLSDAAIARLLGQRGVAVSRRTVAKYRDRMGIANSRRRPGARPGRSQGQRQ
jgi:RNA polymerase sigma-54 factor